MTDINLQLPHSLSQSVAFDRVVAWLKSQEGKAPWGVKATLLKAELDTENHKLTAKIKLTVLGHDETHTLTFASEPGKFVVTSDFADSLIEAGEMRVEQMQLQKQITEVLKP